jgi:hypothetical protein
MLTRAQISNYPTNQSVQASFGDINSVSLSCTNLSILVPKEHSARLRIQTEFNSDTMTSSGGAGQTQEIPGPANRKMFAPAHCSVTYQLLSRQHKTIFWSLP